MVRPRRGRKEGWKGWRGTDAGLQTRAVTDLPIPPGLLRSCRASAAAEAWLDRLPGLVASIVDRWEVSTGSPYDSTAGWAAPARTSAGETCILKIGMPHMEGRDEIVGLRFWSGSPTVRLLRSDTAANAMLLERCEPGHSLKRLPEPDQDPIVCALLRELWRVPPDDLGLRPLSEMLEAWETEAREQTHRLPDEKLFEAGSDVYRSLSGDETPVVALATDLHAGNVLAARRAPWLVIDPKPFLGDPAWDVTQHLLNCADRLHADPSGLVERIAGFTGVDPSRVRAWTFARIAVNPWSDDSRWLETARTLARGM